MSIVIPFKSTPENLKKECSGAKQNTVRHFKLNPQDYRKEILDKYLTGEIKDLEVYIYNDKTRRSMQQEITDVTLFEKDYYIISWRDYKE